MDVEGDAENPYLIVPVLDSDGMNRPVLSLQDNGFTAVMQDKVLNCVSNSRSVTCAGSAVNRTGVYKLLKFKFPGRSLDLELSIK